MVATTPRGHSLKRKKAYNRFPKTDMGVPFDCAFQKYYSIAKWICLAEKIFSFNFYENFRCACRFSVLSLLKQAVHADSPCGISTGKFDSLKTPSKALLSPRREVIILSITKTSPRKPISTLGITKLIVRWSFRRRKLCFHLRREVIIT